VSTGFLRNLFASQRLEGHGTRVITDAIRACRLARCIARERQSVLGNPSVRARLLYEWCRTAASLYATAVWTVALRRLLC